MSEPALMRCMHGSTSLGDPDCAGGQAEVRYLPQSDADAITRPTVPAPGVNGRSNCVVVLVAGAAGHYCAESYQPDGRAIRFCGHGALAAALHVFSELEPAAHELSFFNRHQHWRARRTTLAAADITLIYERPALTRCNVPAFATAVMGEVPIAAAAAGEDDDYLVLEFATAEAVRDLAPDYKALSVATRRAVIATATASVDNRAQDGIVFRYFAPQYGQPEDSATGSAAVQLGAYWATRFGDAGISARQLSARGALMQLVCQAGTVELSARVAYGE